MHPDLERDRHARPSDNGQADFDIAALFHRTAPAIPAVNVEDLLARVEMGQPIPMAEAPSKRVSVFRLFRRRRVLMTRVAAALLLATGILTAWFVFGPGGTNPALAQLQKALEKAKSATYTVTLTIDDQPSQRYRVMALGKNLVRTELPDGSISILDSAAKKVLQLYPKDAKAVIIENISVPSDFSVLGLLSDVNRYAAREQPGVPERTFEGHEATGFVVELDRLKYNVWVDRKTDLPLRFESERKHKVPDGAGGTREQLVKQVWSDFVFGKALDSSLFSFAPPKDYSVERRSADAGATRDADAREKARKGKAK